MIVNHLVLYFMNNDVLYVDQNGKSAPIIETMSKFANSNKGCSLIPLSTFGPDECEGSGDAKFVIIAYEGRKPTLTQCRKYIESKVPFCCMDPIRFDEGTTFQFRP